MLSFLQILFLADVKGRYLMVDKRMLKDKRGKAEADKRAKLRAKRH